MWTSALIYLYAFYGYFLIYCALVKAKDDPTWDPPWYVHIVLATYVLPAFVMDVLFNYTAGAALFFELPWGHGITFTQRCSGHYYEQTRRGAIARWICNGWLNPIYRGHCH